MWSEPGSVDLGKMCFMEIRKKKKPTELTVVFCWKMSPSVVHLELYGAVYNCLFFFPKLCDGMWVYSEIVSSKSNWAGSEQV